MAAGLAVFAALAPQAARSADLGKIMPMGDSITLGVPVNGGYRDPLYALLTNRQDTFTFVGSATGYATEALAAAGQTHHEGHSGYVITNGAGRAGLDEYLANWIGPSAANPDKILLMIGSNDINLGYEMADAPTRLSNMIGHVYALRPNVKLYLASLIPMSAGGHQADVQTFNASLPALVASHRALGHDVVYVPMYEALNISTDLNDGLHPNAQGYLRMAQAWDAALHAGSTQAVSLAVTSPADRRAYAVAATLSATTTVANGTAPYTVQFYRKTGDGAFVAEGLPVTGIGPDFSCSLGALAEGTHQLYATVTDSAEPQGAATSATNTFVVAAGVHAVDVTSAGGGAGLGTSFSVGWDFTVTQPLVVTALGQFDPDGNARSNTVAIYRRGGAKVVESPVLATSPAEQSGIFSARYETITPIVLTNGNYVVFSTQNGNNFIAPNGSPTGVLGAAITWNKGVAMGSGSAAGPLPATAPATWSIENSDATRYLGPTFKYELSAEPPALALVSPTNGQVFGSSAVIAATVSVARAEGSYVVHVYTNSGTAAFAEAGTGSSSPCQVSLGKLPAGRYNIYASLTDAFSTAVTATNTFAVFAPGQQVVELSGWNKDLIIGATEVSPGYNVNMAGWNFYEFGLAGGTKGLPAEAGGTNRTFASSFSSSVKFQFQPYGTNNALYLDGPGSATLTLAVPLKFYSLQFLMTARTMTWYARLNFSDGTSTNSTTWSDPDWTANPGPADRCLTSYGLKKVSDGSFYAGYLWMADREMTLSPLHRTKMLTSITFVTTGAASYQLAVFAVSGLVFDPASDTIRALDLLSAGDGAAGGGTYSVGWDFTVQDTITLTSLGQFDPNGVATSNTVALYQRGGAKLAETTVLPTSDADMSGLYSARYARIRGLVLTNGNYVIVSTQNGDNFISGGGAPAAAFGPAIKWNKGVALASGSSAGPLPLSAPAVWPIENTSAHRYFGPTFTYKLGRVWPAGLMICIK